MQAFPIWWDYPFNSAGDFAAEFTTQRMAWAAVKHQKIHVGLEPGEHVVNALDWTKTHVECRLHLEDYLRIIWHTRVPDLFIYIKR
jgi:hypothetical protein